MNNLLVIDTSATKSQVGLTAQYCMYSRQTTGERQAARQILPLIAELLEEAKLKISDLNGIAVVAGPGSFTGIRIGIGIAQGLSYSQSIPTIALSSLAASAMTLIAQGDDDHLMICRPARANEVYFGAYRTSCAEGVLIIGKEQVCAVDKIDFSILARQSATEWTLVNESQVHGQAVAKMIDVPIKRIVIEPKISLEAVTKLASLGFKSGKGTKADQLKPNYVKDQLDYG